MKGKHARRLGILCVSRELLVAALKLPRGTRIDGMQYAIDNPDFLLLRVEHFDLPELPNGAIIPRIDAELRTTRQTGPHSATRFVRWVT